VSAPAPDALCSVLCVLLLLWPSLSISLLFFLFCAYNAVQGRGYKVPCSLLHLYVSVLSLSHNVFLSICCIIHIHTHVRSSSRKLENVDTEVGAYAERGGGDDREAGSTAGDGAEGERAHADGAGEINIADVVAGEF
jgi:hypothetical protein